MQAQVVSPLTLDFQSGVARLVDEVKGYRIPEQTPEEEHGGGSGKKHDTKAKRLVFASRGGPLP